MTNTHLIDLKNDMQSLVKDINKNKKSNLKSVYFDIISIDKISHKLKFSSAIINSMRSSEKQLYYNLVKNNIYYSVMGYYNLKYQINFGIQQISL